MTFWAFIVGASAIGFGAGAVFMAYAFVQKFTYEVWEITNTEGHTYYVADPAEIDLALQVDELLAVRRIRVLV